MLDNGEYTFNPGRYSTDLIAERSVEFLDDAVAGGRPFFLSVNPIAPHAETIFHAETVFQRGGVQHNPPVPAERHEHLFADAQVPRTPSFNRIVVRHLLPDTFHVKWKANIVPIRSLPQSNT